MYSWSRKKTLGLALLIEGGLFIIACVAAWALGYPLINSFHLAPYHIALGILAVFPAALALSLFMKLRFKPVTDILNLMRQFFQIIMIRTATIDLIFIALLAGLGEETLFRGVLQPFISAYTGPVPGILIAGVVFGAAHYITPLYAAIAGIFGIYLGWLFLHTGNLITPITCHALYDLGAFMYFRHKFSK